MDNFVTWGTDNFAEILRTFVCLYSVGYLAFFLIGVYRIFRKLSPCRCFIAFVTLFGISFFPDFQVPDGVTALAVPTALVCSALWVYSGWRISWP